MLTPGDVAAALNGNRPASEPPAPLTAQQQQQLQALHLMWLDSQRRGSK